MVLIHDLAQISTDQNSNGRLRKAFRWIEMQTIQSFIPKPTESFTLNSVSFIKHSSLSWGGSGWRISNATIVMCTNIWFWFTYVDQPQEDPCSPVIFFFAPFLLSSHPRLKTLFKIGSIVVMLPVGSLSLLVLKFVQLVFGYLYEVILRLYIRLIIKHFDIKGERLAKWSRIANNIGRGFDGVLPYNSYFSRALKKEIWTNDKNVLPTWSDLAKAYAFMSSEEKAAEIAKEKMSAKLQEKPRSAKRNY